MAGAKLKATIVIDGKQYQNEIQDCIKETKKLKETANDTQKELDEMAKGSNLQQGFQKFGKSVGMSNQSMLKFGKGLGFAAKALGTVGLAIGSAKAAYEAYDKVMMSNAITAKEWTAKTGAMRDVTNEFFVALSDGDWSVFENGVINALKLAGAYQRKLQSLRTDLKVNDVLIDKYENELDDIEIKLLSSDLTNAEKNELYPQMVEVIKELKKLYAGTAKALKEKMVAKLDAINVELPEGEIDNIINYMTSSTDEGAALQKLIELERDKKIKSNELKDFNSLDYGNADDAKNAKDALKTKKFLINQEIDALMSTYPELQKMKQVFKRFGDGDELDEFLDWYSKQFGQQARIFGKDRQFIGMLDMFDKNGKFVGNKTTGSGKGGNKTDSKKEITESNSVKRAVQLLNKELDREQKIKEKIENTDVNSPAMKTLQQELKEVRALISYYKRLKIERMLAAYGKKGVGNGKIGPSNAGKSATKVDANNSYQAAKESGFFKNPMKDVGEDDLTWADVAQEGVDSLTSSLSSLSGMLGESAAQWLNFVATFASGIASILPLIEKMITANAAEAGSEAGKQASKIPFGWIAIPAILATVVGMFSALPKFAQGGIVQGSPLGDLNLARVNGGEMMMNTRQQQHLWNVINGGGINNNSTSGKVQFRIAGKELVGVLNNYKNKRETVL